MHVSSVMFDSLQPYGLSPARLWLLCPWNPPGKNTGVGCCFFLQGTFPTQGSNLRLLHWRWILYHWPAPLRLHLFNKLEPWECPKPLCFTYQFLELPQSLHGVLVFASWPLTYLCPCQGCQSPSFESGTQSHNSQSFPTKNILLKVILSSLSL